MSTEEKPLDVDLTEPKKITEDDIKKALSERNPTPGFFEGIGLMVRYVLKRHFKKPNLEDMRKDHE
jgi:hypothetical protein